MEPKFSGYVIAKTGVLHNATNEFLGNTQLGVAGKVTGDSGIFALGEIGYGSVLQVDAKIGKTFDVNNNFDITTSLGGSYAKATCKTDYYRIRMEENSNTPEWKPFDVRGYANAGVNFKGKWGELGVGVQGGVKHSRKPELPPEGLDQSIGITRGTDITGSKTKTYVTPTVNSKINLGKGFSLNFDAALDKGSLGVAWNF